MVIRKQKPISAAFAAFQRRNIIRQTDAWWRAREDGNAWNRRNHNSLTLQDQSCPGLPEVGRYSYTTSQGVGVVSRLLPSCWEANKPSFEGNSLDHG